MADDRRAEQSSDTGPGQEGFLENVLREATTSGTGDNPPPPDEPQAAAMPRRGDDPDEVEETRQD
jgi:hypothetical protein